MNPDHEPEPKPVRDPHTVNLAANPTMNLNLPRTQQ